MKVKDLISIKDLSVDEIGEIFKLAERLKNEIDKVKEEPLKGKTLGLIFEKPSLRTKVSIEVAMAQLGGYTIYLGPDEIRLGQREAIKDVAKTLSRYLDGIVARTFRHQDILGLARHSTIPVINGLSDLSHPCQALADLFTIKEKLGRLKGVKIAFVGDGNNVCNSLLHSCSKLGLNLAVATPKRYEPKKEIYEEAKEIAKSSGGNVVCYNDPYDAVKDADIIYTDVWTSMGQEKESKVRAKAFEGFQVNSKLCSKAKGSCYVMHCLPAHRGEEITDECLDGPHSIVFDQAENRLHVEKAILLLLLT
ncbi:MAG: ornithine carbamoyltransferase [Omnitrophica WOR_2 bacterium SM23_29]|nr:MAG: ornithine carbamoyltransferase [Omnitrophica WOR_2 bacterium SM23_29]